MATQSKLHKAITAAICGAAISTFSMGAFAASAEDDALLNMKSESNIENRSADKSAVYTNQKSDASVDQESEISELNEQQSDRVTSSTDQYQRQDAMADVSMEQTLHFEFDSTELTDEGQQTMEQIKDQFKEKSGKAKVSITGYTDTSGPEAYNQYLSEERAKAVKSELEGAGLEVTEWEVEGKGEANPMGDNDSREGRAENRRVEINISAESSDALSSAVTF